MEKKGYFVFSLCPIKVLEAEFGCPFTSKEFKEKLEEKLGFHHWSRMTENHCLDYAGKKADETYKHCRCQTHFHGLLSFTNEDQLGANDRERAICFCAIGDHLHDEEREAAIQAIEEVFGNIVIERYCLPEPAPV